MQAATTNAAGAGIVASMAATATPGAALTLGLEILPAP
jgi:hypothetical protein